MQLLTSNRATMKPLDLRQGGADWKVFGHRLVSREDHEEEGPFGLHRTGWRLWRISKLLFFGVPLPFGRTEFLAGRIGRVGHWRRKRPEGVGGRIVGRKPVQVSPCFSMLVVGLPSSVEFRNHFQRVQQEGLDCLFSISKELVIGWYGKATKEGRWKPLMLKMDPKKSTGKHSNWYPLPPLPSLGLVQLFSKSPRNQPIRLP